MKVFRWIKTGALIAALLALAFGFEAAVEVAEAQPGVRPVRLFTAFDVDAATFVYCDVTDAPSSFITCDTGGSGDGANDGWMGVRGASEKTVIIAVDAIGLAAGSIQFTVEGRWTDDEGNKVTADLIAPIDKTAVAAGQPVRIVEDVEEIRVGVRINGTDDADTPADEITVHVFSF